MWKSPSDVDGTGAEPESQQHEGNKADQEARGLDAKVSLASKLTEVGQDLPSKPRQGDCL